MKVDYYEKALVFKNGRLVNVLDEGTHWVNPFATIVRYDVTELFYHQTDLDLLLQCDALADRMNVVTIADHEIAIEYKSDNYNTVLNPGKYAYWNEGNELRHDIIDLNEIEVDSSISRKVLQKPHVAAHLNVYKIDSFEGAVLHVDGEFVKTLAPGSHYFWKGEQITSVSRVDMRKQVVEVSGQELLTADKATIRMSLFARYQVVDLTKALVETKDHYHQLYITLQLGLREYIGQHTLDQLLRNKTTIGPYIMDYASEKAENLGITLLDCGIKDIILPGDIKEIMNQVLIAEKKAQANTIMRREETASTRSLLNTAKLMSDNDMLFKLKEMEYMEKIADKVGEITVNGGSRVVDQLRELVGTK